MLYICLFIPFVVAIDNGLGITPPMGWRSWNLYGRNVNQKLIMDQMTALVTKKRMVNGKLMSLKDLGYTDVGLDDAWQKCGSYGPNKNSYHEETGQPVVDKSVFPDMKQMTDHAHGLGITAGWYHNNCICRDHVTDEKYYEADAKSIADFGFDAVKFDGCGKQLDLDLWAKKLNDTGRPVLIENCHWGGTTPTKDWCPWNYYRTSGDVRANYGSVLKNLGSVTQWLEKGLTTPGCWAYPDMLEIGCKGRVKGDTGLSIEETRTHFGSWAIVSSPLILSHDMRNDTMTDIIWPIIANNEVIAVNQAWYGSAGGVFKQSEQLAQVHFVNETHDYNYGHPAHVYYYKPIKDNQVAVLMMNIADDSPLKLNLADIPGWPKDSKAHVRDIWNHQDVGTNADSYTCNAKQRDCCFLVLTSDSQRPEKERQLS